MTTRREFLKGLGITAGAVAATKLHVPDKPAVFPDDSVVAEDGFGLAPIKQEGAQVVYENGVIVKGNHPEALWPGLEKHVKETYARLEDDATISIFSGDLI